MRMSVSQRRSALAEAALRVLSTQGLQATTTRAIVAEAGMSLASLHYAYPSRDALLREAVAIVVADERTALESALAVAEDAGTGPAALERLVVAALEGYLATIDAHPGREHGMLEVTLASARSDELAGVAREQYAQYRALVATMLEVAATRTGMRWLRDVDELASTIVAIGDGLTIARIVEGSAPAGIEVIAAAIAAQAEEAS